MYTKIELGENAHLWESYLGGVVVKFFTFEYIGVTTDTELEYIIYYNPVEFKDKFRVEHFGNSLVFDTLLEAKEYVYKNVKETKEKLDKEQEEIKEHIRKTRKKKRIRGDEDGN